MSQELKEKIRKQVRQAIAEKVNNQQNKSESKEIVSEGKLHQAISRIGGGLVGGGLGALVGITGFKGIIAALASAGVIVSTNVLGAIGIGLAAAGLLGGAVVGGTMGERGAIRRDIKKIDDTLMRLDDVINARDDVLVRITHLKNERDLPRLDKEFARLTQEQIRVAQELAKMIEEEYDSGTINAISYHKVKEDLLPLALEGKLSNLALSLSGSIANQVG